MKKVLRLLPWILCAAILPMTACSKESDEPENGDQTVVDPNKPNANGVVVSNGLLAYFPFNGNFDDISGSDIYGYGSPDPTFVEDGIKPGTSAAKFSRPAKSAFIVGDGLIDSRKMSICFWVKNISDGTIFHLTSAEKEYGEIMMTFAYSDDHLKYVISRYNNHYQFDKTGNFSHKAITDDNWHHIALVSDYNESMYSAATTSLYIDGRLMDTVTEKINIFGEAEKPHYGSGTKFILGGDNVPNMQIAYLRIYDARLLSEQEIKAIYDAKQ